MSSLLARARDEGAPIVLLLDSSGARVDEGLPALGAFRVLLRETLLTRLAQAAHARGRGARLLRRREPPRLHLQPAAVSDGRKIRGIGPGGDRGRDRCSAVRCAQPRQRRRADGRALPASSVDAHGALVEDAPSAVSAAVRGWLREFRLERRPGVRRRSTMSQGARLLAAGVAAVRARGQRGRIGASGRHSSARLSAASGGGRVLRASAGGIARGCVPGDAQRRTGWRGDLLATHGLVACAASRTIRRARSSCCSTRTGMPLPSPTSGCCCRLTWCT